MTDIPAQPGASTTVEAGRSARGRAGAAASEALDKAGDALHDAADKAGDKIHEVAVEAGEKLQEVAGRAGEAAQKAEEKLVEAGKAAIDRIRNNATLPSERGSTMIANEVVEKIAGIAAREVPGVYDLGGNTARVLSAVRERLHLGDESQRQGVTAKLQGKEADLAITLVLEYGFVVSSVTDKVREKAISAVEKLLELDVTNVDILVDDVHAENDGKVDDDVARAAGYSTDTQGIKVGS
jgi:uncharacterized alkaline shock family protein YloU